MDENQLAFLSDDKVPIEVRSKIGEKWASAGEAERTWALEKQRLDNDRQTTKWNTPLVAAAAGLITLTATYVFDRLTAQEQTSNTITLEQIRNEMQLVVSEGETTNTITLEQVRNELEQSEARLKQELEIGKTRSIAEIEAEAKEREFQYEIVRAELTNAEKSEAERAAVLLFLARAGVLGTLNTDELISMVREQQANPGNVIIPTLSGSIEKRVEQAKEAIDEIEKELLAVPEDILEEFKDLADSPNTGIIKLLPRGNYSESILPNGGGSFYSFTMRTHEYGYGSDIQLDNRKFSVGFAGADYGFFLQIGRQEPLALLELGRTPPNALEPGMHEAWAHMYDYEPPILLAEARLESRKYSWETVRIGNALLHDTVPAIKGNSYLLRSINGGESDILVALNILEETEDGSFVILWKLLQRFPIVEFTGPDHQD